MSSDPSDSADPTDETSEPEHDEVSRDEPPAEPDPVDETGRESFPASDPPAWGPVTGEKRGTERE